MNTTLYPICALFAWAVVLAGVKRLPVMLKQPPRLVTWALYLFFALIFTVGWAGVWDRIDSWTGLPESNTLITMCLVVCYSASALVLLQQWSYVAEQARRRVRFTVGATAAVLIAMVLLFVHSDTAHHQQQSFTAWYGGSAEYDAYLLVYLTAFTAVEVEVIRLCHRYAKLTSRSWLRTGLITASVGATIGLLYSLTRLADIAAARAGVDISRGEDIAEAGAGLGALLVMIGLTMHRWGPRVSTLRQRGRRLIAYARLRPLWACFYTLDPSIAFDDRRRTKAMPAFDFVRSAGRLLADPEYHVARRVIEIRDGILAMHPYQDPDVRERARTHFGTCGLSGEDLDAAITAAQIRAALASRDKSPHRDQPAFSTAGNTPANLDAELTWLIKVTKYFTRNPKQFNAPNSTDAAPLGGTS